MSLYLVYIVSWVVTAIAELTYFAVIWRRVSGAAESRVRYFREKFPRQGGTFFPRLRLIKYRHDKGGIADAKERKNAAIPPAGEMDRRNRRTAAVILAAGLLLWPGQGALSGTAQALSTVERPETVPYPQDADYFKEDGSFDDEAYTPPMRHG